MEKIIRHSEIESVLKDIDLIPIIEAGFAEFSRGKVIVPPVGEMLFDNPAGDAHIKYGYILNDDHFVIKIATGFYENVKLGLSSSNGLMLIFSQKTGVLEAILLDEGLLTDVRTAVAGAVAAKHLAPKQVTQIGVFGAGIQGKLQVEYLRSITECKKLFVWGISQQELALYAEEMTQKGYEVWTTQDAAEILGNCNLIVTSTPSKEPLISVDQIQPGTHITAMGSDTPEKIELDPAILQKADIVVADSLEQSKTRGEVFRAGEAGHLAGKTVLELGNVIIDPTLSRSSEDQITVADLTGVAVQDIKIATAVYNKLLTK